MSNQVGANLTNISTIYYAGVNPIQVHNFYKQMVYAAYGSDRLFAWLDLKTARSTRPATTFYHVENDRLTQPITVSATSGAVGAAANVTITNASAYLNSGTMANVQPGYKIFDGTNYYTINSVNTTTPYAWIINVTADLATIGVSFAAGQTVLINTAQSVIEGSSAGLNSIRGQGVIFQNTMQEFRRDWTVTGQALASFDQDVVFWPYQNPLTLEMDQVWSHAEADRVYLEFMNAMEEYGITGQAVTNTSLQATNGLGTTGVIPGIKAWGNTANYSKAVGWTISDFQDMAILMEKNQSVKEWECWGGIEWILDAQNAIKDWFPNGSVSYGAFGSQEAALEYGFQSFGAFQRTWHFHNMQIFNRPDFLGAALVNGDYTGCAIVLPTGKTIGTSKYGQPTQQVDYIERVTLFGNGRDYGYDHWIVDGMGYFSGSPLLRPTTQRVTAMCWATTLGIELNAAKQLHYIQRTA